MGKFNNSIDIIPIPSSSYQNHQGVSRNTYLINKMKKHHRAHVSDPMLVPRVKRYLEDNLDQTYVDVSTMTSYLRGRYMEYSRRKEHPFRIMVESAYKSVLKDYGLDSGTDDSDEKVSGSDDDLQMMEAGNNHNRLNDCLQNMYNKQKNNHTKTSNNAAGSSELIDIIDSSDEEGEVLQKMRADKLNKGLLPTPVSAMEIAKVAARFADVRPPPVKQPATQTLSQAERRRERFDTPLPTNTNPWNSQNTPRKRKAGDLENQTVKRKKSDCNTLKPIITFRDVGGIDNILKDLCDMLLHIKHPEVYRHLGTQPPRGFLLHGPPGCGKTLLANAIAGKLQIPLISVVATELVAGVSGESEERIREIFDQAIALAPCVLFVDEVDIISSNRANAQKDMERRIVSQLISCMDALSTKEKGDQVLVIGATNRADALDPSLRRVGRFDQEICLGIPDRKARTSILKVVCQHLSLQPDFDFDHLAQLTPGYVGADLLALSSKAAANAVKRVFYAQKQQRTQTPEAIVDVEDCIEDADKIVLVEKETKNEPTKNTSINVIDLDQPINLDDDDKVESTSEKEIDKSNINGTTKSVDNNDKNSDEVTLITDEGDDKAEPDTTDSKTNEEVSNKPIEPKSVKEGNSGDKASETVVEEVKDTAVDVEEVEKMSVVSNSSDHTKKIEIVKEWTLEEMEAWIDDPEPPLNSKQLNNLVITMEDFELALKTIQPSAKREGFITVPGVTWDEIGSLRDIRSELQMAILAPVRYPDRLLKLGLNAPSGVLLCGPPGCGKTLLAKAIANEAGINFISVKGPELLNMYVGESERAVRQCFNRARNSAPCVIFFDEFDALCPKRSGGSEGGVSSRVVNQLLTEMDGVEGRAGVFLMAATNRPDIVDPAVMRPGRLDKILYVGLPNASDRLEILQAVTKNGTKPALHSDVDLSVVANNQACVGYTGADLAGLVRQASMQALRESMTQPEPVVDLCVTQKHFLQALASIRPSVSLEDQKHYEKLRKKYAVSSAGKESGEAYEPMDDS